MGGTSSDDVGVILFSSQKEIVVKVVAIIQTNVPVVSNAKTSDISQYAIEY